MSDDRFDITEGKNRYKPCPRCRSEFEMGLRGRIVKPWPDLGMLAVQCGRCDFRGPEVINKANSQTDKAAFDAWNDLPRPVDDLTKYQRANW